MHIESAQEHLRVGKIPSLHFLCFRAWTVFSPTVPAFALKPSLLLRSLQPFLFFSLLLCSSLLHSTLCYPFSLFSFCYSSPPFLLPFSFILFATPVCSVLLVSFILCSAFLFSPPSSLPSSSLLFSFLVFPPRLYPLIISCVDHPVSLSPRINGHS